MLLAAVLVDALHAALEDREEAPNRVRVRVAPNVLIEAMVHHLMPIKQGTRLAVVGGLVGH